MSYTYSDVLECKGYIKAGSYLQATTYVAAGSYVDATTQLRAGTTVKATGGLQLVHYIFKCPTSANSVAVTGLAATQRIESCYGVRMSAALVKTVGNLTTAATLGTNKVILAAIKALSNAAIHLLVHARA